MFGQPQLHADEVYDLTPEDELPSPLEEAVLHELGLDDPADRDSGDPLPTEYGEQAAEYMVGEEFDDLLDLLNSATGNAGDAAIKHIKALSGIYSELLVTAQRRGTLSVNDNLR